MSTYRVTYQGTIQETYYVEADTAEEAKDSWSSFPPEQSEVIGGEVIEVEQVEE